MALHVPAADPRLHAGRAVDLTTAELAELLLKEPPDDEVGISYEGVYTSVVVLTEHHLTDGTRILIIEADEGRDLTQVMQVPKPYDWQAEGVLDEEGGD